MQLTQHSEHAASWEVAVPQQTNLSILHVEDEADDYRALSRLMSELGGFSVNMTRASSGLAARNSLLTGCYDVVIADYRLGRETGVEVIDSIARQRKDIALILLTSNLSSEVREAALSAGAILCIDKDDLSATSLESALHIAIHRVFQDRIHQVFQEDEEGVAGGGLNKWLH
jgi:CheY-like chemotaxis protein